MSLVQICLMRKVLGVWRIKVFKETPFRGEARIVGSIASSMMKGINQSQRFGVKKVCSKKACKAREYKAKQFKTKSTGNSWGGWLF